MFTLSTGIVTASYIAASILFILSLGGLSNQETARRGNLYGMMGMGLAIFATVFGGSITSFTILLAMGAIGGTIGAVMAKRVEMTGMPELIAMLHSFVGLAAVLVGFASFLDPNIHHTGVEKTIHNVEVFLGVFIGAVTFTGSIIAWGKLNGKIGSNPLIIPARHLFNLALILGSIGLGAAFMMGDPNAPSFLGLGLGAGVDYLIIMTLLAFVFSVHMVMAIGGADMPVVISMLNSYSGWAAAATGFMLSNDLLIVTGALVGSSGAILSIIMCNAMNRKFLAVIFGGFGEVAKSGGGGKVTPGGDATAIDSAETAELLKDAKNVVIVPGYGMAVGRAQHVVSDLTKKLQARGTKIRFAIHPVAGRMPGHMNVLLAEARLPYDIVLEMEEINDDFASVDLVLVIGANDICNPLALSDPTCPIAGMPVLEVWNATRTVVLKRSLGVGYAGIDNPLFYLENNDMLFGDAKVSVDGILKEM